jgi:outer membrane protein TolC
MHRWILLMACAAPAAFAADPVSLSLETAVSVALERAPEITGGRAGVEAAQALIESAGRLPDPSLIVGVENLPVNGPDAYSTSRDFMTMRKVGVMQAFPRREKRELQHQRALADSDRASSDLAVARAEVARQTAEAWIRLFAARQSLDALRTLQPDLETGAQVARAGVIGGRTSSAEALMAEAAAARIRTRLLQAQGEERQALAALGRWIGDDAQRPLADLPSLERLPVSAETLLSSPHLHAELLPYEARIEAARTDVALARADRRPDWAGELSFAKRGPDFSDMVSLQFTVGLPLFSKHRQDPVIAARTAQLRQLEAERETQVRMHTEEAQQAVIAWQQLGEQLTQFERELAPLARERTNVALASYRGGGGELRPVLEAVADEADLVIERAALTNERGRAWAYLRYLQPEHLHAQETAP